MEFKAFLQKLSGNVITLFNDSPIKNVTDIQSYTEDINGAFRKREFRWSSDRSTWSDWQILNQGNFQMVQPTTNVSDLYLEFKYVRHSPNNGQVYGMMINYNAGVSSSTTTTTTPSTSSSSSSSNDNCATTHQLIDADLLNGKPGSYYLWRGNHQGTQSISTVDGLASILNNLSNGIQQTIIDGFNVDGSGAGVFYQKENRALYFKRIVSANNDIIISDNDGIITLAFDASLASKDPSVNELYQIVEDLGIEISDLSTYVDSQFFNVEASINQIWDYLENIDVSLGGLNIGSGQGEVFQDVSNNVFRFRTIKGLGDVSVNTNTTTGEIEIFIDASSAGGPIWTDTDPVSADVGGIIGGETVSSGSNSIDVLENMLYEYFPPSVDVSIQYYGTGINNPQYYEKWVFPVPGPWDISVNFSCVSKVIVKDFGYVLNDGTIFHTEVKDSSTGYLNTSITSPMWDDLKLSVRLENQFLLNGTTIMPDYDVSIWDINFVNATYYGIVPNSITKDNITQSDIEGLNKLIIPHQTNDLVFDNSTNQSQIKFVYAYDASYGDLRSIFDVKNDFNVTTSFDQTTINFTGVGSSPGPIPYKVYIKSHWIDVSTFRLIFNI